MKRARHRFGAKFGNKPTTVAGRRYDSKAEARYAVHLGTLRDAGMVLGWLEQVPFRFPCGTKYVADMMVFYTDGTCQLVDVKGVETPAFKIKARMMAAHYPWMPLIIVPAKAVPR